MLKYKIIISLNERWQHPETILQPVDYLASVCPNHGVIGAYSGQMNNEKSDCNYAGLRPLKPISSSILLAIFFGSLNSGFDTLVSSLTLLHAANKRQQLTSA
jgi:hypothetical protein